MAKIPSMAELLTKEIQVEVPYCDGVEIMRHTLKSPAIRLTGRRGVLGVGLLLEVEYKDYEVGLYPNHQKRLSKMFVPFNEILFIEPEGEE